MQAREAILKSLLGRALAGEAAAYREFLSAASVVLRRYVRKQLARLGRPECEAEDIVQEALLAIHSRVHTYDDKVPVTAWMHAITRYKMIDFLRASTPAGQVLSLDDIEHLAGDKGDRSDTALTVKAIVAALPARFRAPIELMKLEGFSVAETARQTGMSESAVKVYVHRGLKTLGRMLG